MKTKLVESAAGAPPYWILKADFFECNGFRCRAKRLSTSAISTRLNVVIFLLQHFVTLTFVQIIARSLFADWIRELSSIHAFLEVPHNRVYIGPSSEFPSGHFHALCLKRSSQRNCWWKGPVGSGVACGAQSRYYHVVNSCNFP